MKYLVRFLKILFIIGFSIVIGIPFAVLMMFVAIFSLWPIFIILCIKTGDADKSFDNAIDIMFEKIWFGIGYVPLSWVGEIII